MRTISLLTANSVWIEPWMRNDRHSVAGEQSEWEIIWRTHGSNRMHMEQDCVLAWTHILLETNVIICVPLITTMEWCNPLRLDLRTHYSTLQFCFLCSLTLLLVWLLSSLLSGMFILSPKVSTDTLFIACVGIKHKGCFLGIFTFMDWWKSVKSQREYTTFGVMIILQATIAGWNGVKWKVKFLSTCCLNMSFAGGR